MKRLILPLTIIFILVFALIGNCAWLSGYDQRIKLTIDHTKIDSDLSDFPVTVFFTSIQGEEIFTEFDADSDYMKCAFTSSDGTTQLYAEKELFDVSEQKAIYHVKVPTVSSSTDTVIYYYYDNDHADNTTYVGAIGTTAGENVWDSNFKAVYHMVDNTTSTILDSTSNNNDGTKKAANEPVEVSGKVGQAQHGDGSDDRIDCGAALDFDDVFTIEAIFSSDLDLIGDQANTWFGGIMVAESDAYPIGYYIGWQGWTNGWSTIFYSNETKYGTDGQEEMPTDTYKYIAGTYDQNWIKIYVNGVEDASKDVGAKVIDTSGNFNLYIFDNPANYEWDGIIDEVRISHLARSDAWIKATYNTLWDTLLTYGSEETKEEANSIFFGCNF